MLTAWEWGGKRGERERDGSLKKIAYEVQVLLQMTFFKSNKKTKTSVLSF